MAKKILNREVETEMSFKKPGTFGGYYAACGWLSAHGYSYGSTSNNRSTGAKEPVAICKGEYNLPQKWHNLSKEEKQSVIGVMDSNDYREGEVKIYFFKS